MEWTEYKSFSKEELEIQYSPSRWSKRMGPDAVLEAHVKVLTEESTKSRENVECQLDVSYGLMNKEKLDIFAADTLPGEAPIFVYIHGGYWQFLSREMSSFCVQPLTSAGAVVIAVGYETAPEADISTIVNQVKKGVMYVLNFAKRRSSRGVYLCGHSAGAHLAAMMLATDWVGETMHSDSDIKGALLVSGVYDLRPLVNTYVNDPLQMTVESAWQNSPMNHIQSICKRSKHRNIIVAVGEHDSPEFRKHSGLFEKELQNANINCKLVDVANTDHFDAIENLKDKSYILTKEAVHLMNLHLDGAETTMSSVKLS